MGHRWLRGKPLVQDCLRWADSPLLAGNDLPGRPQAENTPRFLGVCYVGPSRLPVLIFLHLSLSLFILTSVYFITLPSRGHSYPVKETMILRFIFLNLHPLQDINLAGIDFPGLH